MLVLYGIDISLRGILRTGIGFSGILLKHRSCKMGYIGEDHHHRGKCEIMKDTYYKICLEMLSYEREREE